MRGLRPPCLALQTVENYVLYLLSAAVRATHLAMPVNSEMLLIIMEFF
jgi:hypothetical protein